MHGRRVQGGWRDRREANTLDFYRVYACADGGSIAISAVEPQFWQNAVAVLELPAEVAARQEDRDHWPEMIARFAFRPRQAWDAAFVGVDACGTQVLSVDEAFRNPQMGRCSVP